MAPKVNTGQVGTDGQTVTNANSNSPDPWDTVSVVATGTGSTSSATFSGTNPLLAGRYSTRLKTSNPVVAADRARIWWTLNVSDQVAVRFRFRCRVDPGGAFTIHQWQVDTSFSGLCSIRVTTVSGQRRLQLADAAGQLLADAGPITFGSGVSNWYTVDTGMVRGTTTSNGTARFRAWDYQDTPLQLTDSAGNSVGTSFEKTNANTIASTTTSVARSVWGGSASVLQDLDIIDAKMVPDSAAFVGLPAANVGPTATIQARTVPQAPGPVTVTGTITDPDGTVKTATATIVSGPNFPVVSTSTSGLNTGTCNVTATFTGQPGRYVVQITGTDNNDAAATPVTQIVDVYSVDPLGVVPYAQLTTGGETVVGAPDAITAWTDESAASYTTTGEAPNGTQVQTVQWCSFGPGDIKFTFYGYQTAATPIIDVTVQVYLEDGTTKIYEETYAGSAGETANVIALSPAANSAAPVGSARRALITKTTKKMRTT